MGTEAIQKGNEMLKTNLHKRAIACLMAVAAVASAGCLATWSEYGDSFRAHSSQSVSSNES